MSKPDDIRVDGDRSDTGKITHITGFDLTPWQEEKASEVVVSYIKRPFEGRVIFAFKVNKEDLEAFESMCDKEDIHLLRENSD